MKERRYLVRIGLKFFEMGANSMFQFILEGSAKKIL